MNVETKYLRMIQGMKRRGRKDWTVYILRCGDGSLYTGIAKDVGARVKQHSEGRGASYTLAARRRGTTGKGGTQWETRAAKKIRKRVRNRMPRNRNKNQKTPLISSQKESLDRNHGVFILTALIPMFVRGKENSPKEFPYFCRESYTLPTREPSLCGRGNIPPLI